MKRKTGLLAAGVLKLLAIAGAVFLDRASTGIPAIFLLPTVGILGGLSLGRGDQRLSAGVTAAFSVINAIGFPMVLWAIDHLRFGDTRDPQGLLMLAIMLAAPGLLVAPAITWALTQKLAPKTA
jgi:hypothetical protein